MNRLFQMMAIPLARPAALLTLSTLLLVGCGSAPDAGGEASGDSGAEDTAAPGEVAIETETIAAEDVEITAEIVVENQPAEGSFIIVESIVAPADGWVVLYSDAEGEPGDVVGQEQVFLGLNPRVPVDLGEEPANGTKLVAVLHEDTGAAGEFEFPGADQPWELDGSNVMASFEIQAGAE